MKVFLCLVMLVEVHGLKNNTSELVVEYLRENKVKLCVFLLCWNYLDKMNMEAIISRNSEMGIRVAFLEAEEASVTKIRREKYVKTTFVLDLHCKKSQEILTAGSQLNKFGSSYNWLLIAQSEISKDVVRDTFNGLNLRLDSDVQLAIPKNKDGQYEILEVYDLGLEADVTVNKIGCFKNGKLHYFDKDRSYYERRKDLTGVLIRNGNTVNYTTSLLSRDLNEVSYKENGTFRLFHLQLFMTLASVHNFRYNTTIDPSESGNLLSASDSGIGQLLQEDKIDISSAPGILTSSGPHYFNFLLPYLELKSCFFFRNPDSVESGVQVLKPFQSKVWFSIIATLGVISLAMKTAYWVEETFLHFEKRHHFFTPSLTVISIMTLQGSEEVPRYIGGRIAFLGLLFFSICTYNFYTSILVSIRLSTKPKMLTTYKQLYESNLQLGIENDPSTYNYILQHQNDYYLKLLTNNIFRQTPKFFPPRKGIEEIQNGGFAYHTLTFTAYPIIAHSFEQEAICNLGEINVITEFLSLATPKNSQYTELFRISLMKMWEVGVFKRERDFWIPRSQECRLKAVDGSVGTNELFLVYFILFGGMVLAILVFLVEVIWFKLCEKKKIVEDNRTLGYIEKTY